MKRKSFFLIFVVLIAASLFSCVSFDEETPVKYTLYLNDVPVAGDSLHYLTGQQVTAVVRDAAGKAVAATFDFGNGTKIFGDQAASSYQNGKYHLSAAFGNQNLGADIIVSRALNFTLKINGQAIAPGATFKTVAKTPLTFKVVNADGHVLQSDFDCGNGSKLAATDSVTISYQDGKYDFKVTTGKNVITIKLEVAKVNSESVVLLSSSLSGTTINAVFGLKCSLISSVSFAKDTYVSGEIPGQYWKDYKVIPTDTAQIDGVSYFKWKISAPAGKFRFSWIQLKDGETQFSYDHCNWANDLGSKYWSTGDGLFVMYTKIVNGQAIISPTN